MRAGLVDGPPGFKRSVPADDAVIPDVRPAVPFDVPVAYLFDAHIHAGPGSRAMNYDFIDVPHAYLAMICDKHSTGF